MVVRCAMVSLGAVGLLGIRGGGELRFVLVVARVIGALMGAVGMQGTKEAVDPRRGGRRPMTASLFAAGLNCGIELISVANQYSDEK